MEGLVWHTEKRKIKDLIPTEGNPRLMTKEQAVDLEKSLKKFNLVDIPAINTDNRIASGHQRITLLIALGRGDEEIDVRVPNRQLTEGEHREYMIRANKNLGEWDVNLLANLEVDLLKDVGFSDEELNDIFQLGEEKKSNQEDLVCDECEKKFGVYRWSRKLHKNKNRQLFCSTECCVKYQEKGEVK